MKFTKRPSLTSRDIRIISFLILLALIALSVLTGVNIGLSRIVPGGGDFYVGWVASRAFLFAHIEPYSGVVATQVQQLVFGANAASGQNPYYLTAPFYILPFYFPFALISDLLPTLFPSIVIDAGTLRGLWMVFAEAALCLTAFLTLRLIEWGPRRFFLFLIFLLPLFSFYSASALFNGSPAIFLCLLFIGILFSFYAGLDELAGALLAFSLFLWEAGFVFILLIFLRIFFERRGRILAGFGMTLAVALAISFLMYGGNWFYPFLTANLASYRADFGLSTNLVFSHLWPDSATSITLIVRTVSIIVIIYEWYVSRYSDDFRRFIWLACLALAFTPLLGLRTNMSNLVLLFPSIILILASTIERWRTGYWLGTLLWLTALIFPWSLYVRSILLNDQLSMDLLFLFYPLFIIVGLYWTRWWFLRPPRTWLDHVRSLRTT